MVQWDFNNLVMEFDYGSKHHLLKGGPPNKVKTVEGSHSLLISANQLYMLQLVNNPRIEDDFTLFHLEKTNAIFTPYITSLLENFSDVFSAPKGLSPSRGMLDHRIPIEYGTNPINVRPYWYPLNQRDIIEQIVQDMLTQGIIQESGSPFTSPVVLVGKNDGSWRLCVDYRALNSKTVKNKSPIPVVDELIDELAGSRIFSKIDLRAGYHQLRVALADVHKTAFKTHHGHFEFLVMPFGLTNAPPSFQSWMNFIFKPLLRKPSLL